MTRNPGTYGADLASDLLADLNRPLPLDRPATPLTAVDSVRPAPTRSAASRGPAVEGSLRIGLIDWCKPFLSIGSGSATIRCGPVRCFLGIRAG